jgi:uncharacterized membrane protein YjgN (DUF898 family)
MVTLGLYLAWAKTERRQYVWSNLSFHGHNLRYTGTGLELFKGYAIVVGFYLVCLSIIALAGTVSGTASVLIEGAMVLTIGLVSPILIFRSRAFIYSRTAWRGIRFGLAPNSAKFAKTFLSGIVLTVLTLGFYFPIMSNRLYKIMTDSTRFGNLEFHYDGSDREVFWMAVKGVLLFLVTFGIYFFWYRARLTRYRLEHTHAGNHAALRSKLTGIDLYGLMLLQIFGTTLSLGLAFPWITIHTLRRLAERTTLVGFVDFESIEQRAVDGGASADGLADALNLDLGF